MCTRVLLLILKTIGNRKGDCAWSCSRWQTQPEKICKSQRTNQCHSLRTLYWFVLCNLQIFSGCVCHLEQLHAQSPFLFPIVFSINLIPFFDICSVDLLAVFQPGCSGMQWISFFLRKTLNSRLWKTHGKKGMEKYEKSCDGLPSSPKSKRGGQAFGILAISTTPIFGGLWGAFHVMCAQLRPVGTTTSLGSVRRLPTRSAVPVSLDRPPLSPRLSARWTQCDDHPLRDHVRERCGQGERRRLMHLTRSGLTSNQAHPR